MAKLSKERVILDFRKIHGDKYDYSKMEYIKTKIPIVIICPEHGEFTQQPLHHKAGSGCPGCRDLTKNRKSLVEHLENTPTYQKEIYNYLDILYENSQSYFKINCRECDFIFIQKTDNHKNGSGCPRCATGKKSKGEKRILRILEESNIEFEFQKTFEKCINPETNYKLYFDFYLNAYNLCIEFDGQHHFIENEKFGGLEEFKKTKFRDKLKTDFCEKNNINLIRIKYDENIENKIKEILNAN